MCDIVIIRPPATLYDEQGRIQGRLDLPSAEDDGSPCEELIAELESLAVKAVLTDPGEPAAGYAAAIGQRLRVPVKTKEDLRNVDQGLWQGLKLDEIRRKYPRLIKQWEEQPDSVRPPDGESLADASERVRKALKKPLKKSGVVAVVVAEPLASLVASIVSGEDRLRRGPVCSGDGDAAELVRRPADHADEAALAAATSGAEDAR
ncbi:MAG: histidine phosphatase family protein [Planctomycetota bacterium]